MYVLMHSSLINSFQHFNFSGNLNFYLGGNYHKNQEFWGFFCQKQLVTLIIFHYVDKRVTPLKKSSRICILKWSPSCVNVQVMWSIRQNIKLLILSKTFPFSLVYKITPVWVSYRPMIMPSFGAQNGSCGSIWLLIFGMIHTFWPIIKVLTTF